MVNYSVRPSLVVGGANGFWSQRPFPPYMSCLRRMSVCRSLEKYATKLHDAGVVSAHRWCTVDHLCVCASFESTARACSGHAKARLEGRQSPRMRAFIITPTCHVPYTTKRCISKDDHKVGAHSSLIIIVRVVVWVVRIEARQQCLLQLLLKFVLGLFRCHLRVLSGGGRETERKREDERTWRSSDPRCTME